MRIDDAVFVYRLAEGENLAWHGRYHSHSANQFEIHFFITGEGSFLLNKTRCPIQPNSLFLCGPHEFHCILPEQVKLPITYYAVLFSVDKEHDADIYQLLTVSLNDGNRLITGPKISRFAFEEMMRLALSEEEGIKKAAEHLLASYLYRWFSCAEEKPRTDSIRRSAYRRCYAQGSDSF